MANSPQSRKRARQEVAARARNVVQRSRFRTYAKKVRAALGEGDPEKSKAAFAEFVSVADKAAGKGLIHPNKTARLKRRLSAATKALAAPAQPARGEASEAG